MTLPTVHVVGAAVVRGGRCLVALRGPGMALAGKWELPGGKVEDGEDPRRALGREMREELGLEVAVGELLGRGDDVQGVGRAARRIALDVYRAEVVAGEVEPREHAAVRWIGADEVARLDWAPADRAVLPALVRCLRTAADAG